MHIQYRCAAAAHHTPQLRCNSWLSHVGYGTCELRTQPAPPPSSMKAQAAAHAGSSAQYSRMRGHSKLKMVSNTRPIASALHGSDSPCGQAAGRRTCVSYSSDPKVLDAGMSVGRDDRPRGKSMLMVGVHKRDDTVVAMRALRRWHGGLRGTCSARPSDVKTSSLTKRPSARMSPCHTPHACRTQPRLCA